MYARHNKDNSKKSFIESIYGILTSKYTISICISITIIIRVLWIFLIDTRPVSDWEWYYQRAIAIASGEGYSVGGIPTAYWPVGYPAFLGLLFFVFGPSLIIAKLSNIALYLGIIILSYFIAKKIFNSKLVANITLVMLCFYPNHIAYSSVLSPEPLFLFLSLLAIYFLLWKDRLALFMFAGIAFGLASLVKPVALFLPFICFGKFIIDSIQNRAKVQRLAIHFVLVIVLMLLTIIPWTIRNYRESGHFILISTNGGVNLLIGNNIQATGGYSWTGELESITQVPGDHGIITEYLRDIRAQKVAIEFIKKNPFEAIKLWPKKFAGLFLTDYDGISESLGRGLKHSGLGGEDKYLHTLSQINQIYYKILLIGSFLYIIYLGSYRRGNLHASRGLMFYFGASACIVILSILFSATKIDLLIGCLFGMCLYKLVKHYNGPIENKNESLGLWIFGYVTVYYLIFFGVPRFHFPLIPWLAMYASSFLALVVQGNVEKDLKS